MRAQNPRPRVGVESGQRLTHEWWMGPRRPVGGRARPAVVLGAEAWVKLVDADAPAPTVPAALTFPTTTTKPSFRTKLEPGVEDHDDDGGCPRRGPNPANPTPKAFVFLR